MNSIILPKGRQSRWAFFRKVLFLIFIQFVILIVFSWGYSPWGTTPIALYILLFLIIIFIQIFQIVLFVERFHDLDQSGWNVLLMLVPLYNIYLLLNLLFKEGTKGPNKFGPDPLNRTVSEDDGNSQ